MGLTPTAARQIVGIHVRDIEWIIALSVVQGQFLQAFFLVTTGIAIPFAIWLGLKMLADILTVLNRSYDRLDALEERFSGISNAPRFPPQSPKALRAGDDGPNYPDGES